MVLQRSGRRPEFSPLDRLFWIIIATIWPDWKNAIEIIQPETVNRWRRQGWRVLFFGRFRKNRGGRPPVDKEIRLLIKRMAFENFTWGAPRIHGELLKLGFKVSEATISRYLSCYFPGWRYLTWKVFFRNQLAAVAGENRVRSNLNSIFLLLLRQFGVSRVSADIAQLSADALAGPMASIPCLVSAHQNQLPEELYRPNLRVTRIRGSPGHKAVASLNVFLLASSHFDGMQCRFVSIPHPPSRSYRSAINLHSKPGCSTAKP